MAATRKKDEVQSKAAAEKVSAAKPVVKAPARKRTAAPKVTVYVQHQGREISVEETVAAVKADWTGETIKTLELYVKPEDNAAYYVVNGAEGGKVAL